ncbi:unnamed protein product [Rangifer tarandus platyrhynchus]|uniref:Uncharacterized protein n=1 Tax=Rangifer tarandus platyrhynchus TaxID=3082113 RepID=A0ABN8XPL0_RANTA|nr:unnamed protein product [Rangifer tarandus platyrhynchus]
MYYAFRDAPYVSVFINSLVHVYVHIYTPYYTYSCLSSLECMGQLHAAAGQQYQDSRAEQRLREQQLREQQLREQQLPYRQFAG